MDNQPSATEQRVQWYHPGEIVIVAHVPSGDQPDLHAGVQDLLERQLPGHVTADPASARSFRFDAPGRDTSLVFVFQKLNQADSPSAVRDAVGAVHDRVGDLRTASGVEVVGAMPHVHLLAHELCSGGSPGSIPMPMYPSPGAPLPARRHHRPTVPALDVADQVASAEPIRVAVLDTRLDLQAARARAEQFQSAANNQQLIETIDRLRQAGHDDPRYAQEWQAVAQHHADGLPPIPGEPAPYPMPDHGLFVAGLVHDIAPRARLSYAPVLDALGVGDLSLLLLGLQQVLADKDPADAQIVNLSLGFVPHPARLPAAWYGLPRPHDRMYLYASALADPARDQDWVSSNRREVDRTVDLLQVGLRELGTYLSLNNCLVVAAAGNDSLLSVEAGQPRMEPRLPARFETVLGVAATTSDPLRAAPYSNLGDERELGDHVATFGGDVTDGLRPEDGVVGVYSGEFPGERPNENGWAVWSGTSFAAALVSGIAANLWAANPEAHAGQIVARLHAAAASSGNYVPALRTPSIPIEATWVSQ